MAEFFDVLTEEHISFIDEQHVFFVASAARSGHVNLSPKGGNTLKVLSPNEILWLNLTGSGNETAAHRLDINRMTLMWCAFEGLPLILRVYGSSEIVHEVDDDWADLASVVPATVGARQYFRVTVEKVQTSCGYNVPLMAFEADRDALTRWSEKRGADGLRSYWREKNAFSMDGLPTEIPES